MGVLKELNRLGGRKVLLAWQDRLGKRNTGSHHDKTREGLGEELQVGLGRPLGHLVEQTCPIRLDEQEVDEQVRQEAMGEEARANDSAGLQHVQEIGHEAVTAVAVPAQMPTRVLPDVVTDVPTTIRR